MKRLALRVLVALVFTCINALGQGKEGAWDATTKAGQAAFKKRQCSEAEKSFREALTAAEKFGEKDARFSVTLLFLAQACDGQSKKDEAEALASRAVDTMDKALKAYKPQQAEQQYQRSD